VRRLAAFRGVLPLLPAAVLLAVVVVLPMLRVAELGLFRVNLDGTTAGFAGLSHVARLWRDERWWAALRNTTIFTVLSVAAETVLGLLFALALHRRFRGRGLVRAAVLLPWALPTAVMALAWAWIFNDSFGVANDLLRRTGLLESPIAWLGEPATAMAALVVADVWKTTPFVALIVLAGLEGLPQELIDAARIDGLSAGARLWHVVLPLVSPSLGIAVAFRALQAWGAFDIVYVMTGGGPGGSTETVSLFVFQSYFRYLDFGYGSAAAVQGVLLAGLLAAIVVGLASRRRRAPA
jgi:multiple sugar transport system permease protein